MYRMNVRIPLSQVNTMEFLDRGGGGGPAADIQLGQLRLIPPGLGLLVLVVGYEVA